MIATVLIGLIAAVCLVSSLILYVFMRSQRSPSSLSPITPVYKKEQIIHSLRPSLQIVTEKLKLHFPVRPSVSSTRSSSSISPSEKDENNSRKQSKSISPLVQKRSHSIAPNLSRIYRPRSSNWQQGSIVDSTQLASIEFSLPSDLSKYRRRSVAVCNNIIPQKQPPTPLLHYPSASLMSFSIIYLNTSQLRIEFHSITLPSNIQLQQLTIKVKLTPDGKEKSIQIRQPMERQTRFAEDTSIVFSNISFEKVQDRALSMAIHGKDSTKKTVRLGHIGKIHLNEINPTHREDRFDLLHEIENNKESSTELYISLSKKDDQHIHLDLERIKGLKIDQKKLDATCYLQIVLLDHHRPLTTIQSQFYRLNSSNFDLNEEHDLNIFTYDSNNLDRFIIKCNLYSNCNSTNEYKRQASIQLASPLFCSGSGTVHWQQFKARQSFSKWHSLNKPQ